MRQNCCDLLKYITTLLRTYIFLWVEFSFKRIPIISVSFLAQERESSAHTAHNVVVVLLYILQNQSRAVKTFSELKNSLYTINKGDIVFLTQIFTYG